MQEYSIQNDFIKLIALDYGATIHQLITKDKNGNNVNIVLGFKERQEYRHNQEYLGASVGRFAGRVHESGFTLNNQHYTLLSNNGAHLHGGKEGFSFKTWKLETIHQGNDPFIKFSYTSSDTEEGYPGNLQVFCTYQLKKNKLIVTYEAKSDKDTIANLTNHNYYNLDGSGNILNHELMIASDKILTKDENAVADGDFMSVESTHYDFRRKNKIGNQIKTKGIDDCYVLANNDPLAVLYAKNTGIEMTVSSNQPGVVVYTPENFDENRFLNKPLHKYPAICFETQGFPNAPNQPHFPSVILKKGELYKNESVFALTVK
ncbi:aldose epimerase family protein [Galbibacter pacificus]|uniref:Galactose mutarotase n=1 Tax=Galbibacter pacificus TaxID=2996052 RepID=A0ABT6FUF3_9FLAO|nr:aldose epimerase family protein [Galbibacter pacificus]MDG3583626.1 galactose mutarotase [Galbibacter pacificus]MDG3586898.1 galactose mutarotase [Galbibacter pacificus]